MDDGRTATWTVGGEAERVLIRRVELRVEEGPDAGKQCLSTGQRVGIGSHESNDLILTDRTVSRFHCDLWIAGDSVILRDRSSRNGTEIDGVRIVEAHLRDGARLKVGNTKLALRLVDDRAAITIAREERFGSLVGRSIAARAMFALLERAAESDAHVLLAGETGTGKELAAESIHNASKRSKGPLIVVDCGALPPDLMESELFGHRRGAFTGAHADREGAFAAASGGTIFLDEIGELPPDLQPKLLRVLEARQIKPIGETVHQSVDVRVIAATHRDLRAEVNLKRFRSDLYFRLAVLEIRLPPLRERVDDLPLLVTEILGSLDIDRADASALLSPPSMARLETYAWPGNIRELRNYIMRWQATGTGNFDSATSAPADAGDTDDFRKARAAWTREFLRQLLGRHEGNVATAARAAGLDRIHLYRLLRQHRLR